MAATNMQVTYERALARAQAEGVVILREIPLTGTADRAWIVRNPTNDERYLVSLASGAGLSCDCKAGQNGQYCKHRAIVRAALLEQKQADESVAVAQASYVAMTAQAGAERVTITDMMGARRAR